MAGAVGLRYWKFLLFDALGAALWVGVAIALGRLFREAIADMLDTLQTLGKYGLMLVLAALAAYVASKWWRRRQFIRQLRMDRVTVDELRQMMDAETRSLILDVRSPLTQSVSGRIPGARAVDMSRIAEGLDGVATDGDVIVYCACPNEASAVKVAKALMQLGFKRVRPLHGGIDAWIAAGHEVEHGRRSGMDAAAPSARVLNCRGRPSPRPATATSRGSQRMSKQADHVEARARRARPLFAGRARREHGLPVRPDSGSIRRPAISSRASRRRRTRCSRTCARSRRRPAASSTTSSS